MRQNKPTLIPVEVLRVSIYFPNLQRITLMLYYISQKYRLPAMQWEIDYRPSFLRSGSEVDAKQNLRFSFLSPRSRSSCPGTLKLSIPIRSTVSS